jgi:hypothetical protein
MIRIVFWLFSQREHVNGNSELNDADLSEMNNMKWEKGGQLWSRQVNLLPKTQTFFNLLNKTHI